MNTQVQKDYYLTKEYGSLERFISYFYQLDAIRKLEPHSVLFVGVGDDMLPGLLKKGGVEVTTLDIDPELEPDVVGDIRSLPFQDGSFDMVCAFQVLEHLPFEELDGILSEMSRVSRRDVLIAVPHRRTGFEFVFRFPFIHTLLNRDFVRLALLFPIRFCGFEESGQHYWEIDWYTTKLGTVRSAFKKYFSITEEKTPVLDPYRRFFILQKHEGKN